jgi:hypothetical protein
MVFDIGSGSYGAVYIAIVTGSFGLGGVNKLPGGSFDSGWSLNVSHLDNTGSVSAFNYSATNVTTKNSLVGLSIGTFVSPFGTQDMEIHVSGSLLANNPPNWTFAPHNFGYTLTLTGEGIIRGLSYDSRGTTEQQSQYNCIYETIPSK